MIEGMTSLRALAITVIAAALLPASIASARDVGDYEGFQPTNDDYDRLTSHEYLRCLDQSGGITLNLRNCAAAEFERQDRRLNQAYRAAMARFPERTARLRLRNLQRRWLATRWDACLRHAEPEEGGTIWLVMMDACSLDEMTRRTAWLERYGRR